MFMEVKLRWRDEWMEMLLWSSKYVRNAPMVSIFPHKPPRTGALQPPCCLWWPWPTFLCFAVRMGPGEPSLGLSTAIPWVPELSQLLCLPESPSYLFMDLSLRTGTAPSAIAVPLQHVAAALWSTHQHEIGSYERGCAINKRSLYPKSFSPLRFQLCTVYFYSTTKTDVLWCFCFSRCTIESAVSCSKSLLIFGEQKELWELSYLAVKIEFSRCTVCFFSSGHTMIKDSLRSSSKGPSEAQALGASCTHLSKLDLGMSRTCVHIRITAAKTHKFSVWSLGFLVSLSLGRKCHDHMET